jgi:hypothetical protein
MRYSPRNRKVACDHEGLTHAGDIHCFHEFLRVLQLHHFQATHLSGVKHSFPWGNSIVAHHPFDPPSSQQPLPLSQMILALLYPIALGLDRLETSSFSFLCAKNGTFQYLTGLEKIVAKDGKTETSRILKLALPCRC